MIMILPGVPKKPSVGQRLSQGIGRGLEVGQQLMQQEQMKKQQAAMGEYGKQLLGIDISHFDPDTQKAILVEGLKQQGKEKLTGNKQEFLNQLFGGQGNQPQQLDQRSQMSEMQQGFDPSQISDADIARASTVDPNLARSLMHAKDVALREKREEQKMQFEERKLGRHEETEISKPVLLELNQARKNIPLQEQAIEDIQNAAPEVSSLDYLADVTGFEPLRTASGAKMKTAIKDFFLSDLTRAGSRPNQWIEQQLADALPKIGRSPEANLIVAEGMKFKVDLAKKRIELMDELVEKDRSKYGFVKGDIDSRAYKLMKPFVEERKKDLKESIQKIKSTKKESQGVRMMSPEGEVWEILPEDVEEAEAHGFQHHATT